MNAAVTFGKLPNNKAYRYSVLVQPGFIYEEKYFCLGKEEVLFYTDFVVGTPANYSIQASCLKISDGSDQEEAMEDIRVYAADEDHTAHARCETYYIGEERELNHYTATVYPKNATDREVMWSSDNDDVISVTEDGVVTMHAPGYATVTCETTDGSGLKVEIAYYVTVNESADEDDDGSYGDVPDSPFTITDGVLTAYSGEAASVEIPAGVTQIGDNAFSNCSQLKRVTLPDGVTGIGQMAFNACEQLVRINFPQSLQTIDDWAFQGCIGLTAVSLPSGLTSLGEGAFSWCQGLTSVFIPEDVTEIPGWAFSDCTALTTVTIPDSVTSISDTAFENCNALSTIICA